MFKLNYPDFWNQKNLYSFLLYPASLTYRSLGFLRKIFAKQKKLCAPVICVGNASVGGTGKTSLIKALAAYLASKKKKIVVISKGYGGKYVKPTIIEPNFPTSLAGDEAVELVEKLFPIGDITVIVAKNPNDCYSLLKNINPDIILVDDGMQNPSFYKDYKILMVDGIRAFGNEMLIPAGPMRESAKSAINSADIVVCVNASNYVSHYLGELAGEKFIQITSKVLVGSEKNDRLFLVCGIGNPDKFFNPMSENHKIVGRISFPDHHEYTREDVDLIAIEAQKVGAHKIVTTAKDYVKLRNFKIKIEIVIASESYDIEDFEKIFKGINEKIQL